MSSKSEMDTKWHNGDKLNDAAKAFHEKYARQPTRLEEARQMNATYIKEIEDYLRSKDLCSRIVYSGSAYEGTKVSKSPDNDDLEFDIMIIMKDGRKLQASEIRPGFVNLHSRAGMEGSLSEILARSRVFASQSGVVDPVKVMETFFGQLQMCINKSQALQSKAKLRKHGPAAQMDVQPDCVNKFYSVDIVPAFEVDGCLYVAKPLKDQEGSIISWRQSFSEKEREKLRAADQSNGCRKQVFRILKVIRNRESAINKLTSYHLKTALFREMDCSAEWSHRDVGKRLMGVLGQLDQALTRGTMPHYFIPEINLLDMSPTTIQNMKDRIHRLWMNEYQIMKILEA